LKALVIKREKSEVDVKMQLGAMVSGIKNVGRRAFKLLYNLTFNKKPKQKAPLFLGALFVYLKLKLSR